MTREFAVDESDQATEQEMWATDLAIRDVRSRGEEILATGFCYGCEERVEYPKNFCDHECASDYEKAKRR